MSSDNDLTPERWHQVSEIVADCLELDDGAAREALVVEACRGDTALLAQVRSLLTADARRAKALSRTRIGNALHAALESESDRVAQSWVGRRLGAYQIVSEIARGGMGTVFKAVRADDAYEKAVAIKLIRDGASHDDVTHRFRAERQILASLEHPNIAHLIDGGQADDGTPFLVMEFVDGVPIDRYCDDQALNVSQRLKLFQAVCGAVHFAHQRLVVHRDLKPSNILVDQTAAVKLLDFGIAKLLDAAVSDAAGQALANPTVGNAMTAAYASPEQVKGEAITTASDVYALGVLLYRLLTGHSPYKHDVTEPLALAKDIVDADPERPSTVVTRARTTQSDARMTKSVDTEKVARTLDTRRLQRELRGDLDNIVLMALRKEPARRYASAEQLSEDIARCLNNQPVIARADTLSYRSTKFITRNKWAVAASSLAAMALLVVTGFATYQARVATAEKLRAEKHFSSVRRFANFTLTDLHRGIKDLPGSARVRKQLVEAAVGYLDGLAQDTGGDPMLTSELGMGYVSLADIQGIAVAEAQLGEQSAARQSLERGIALLAVAHESSPRNSEIAHKYALALRKQTEYEWSSLRFEAAAIAIRRAIEVGDAIVNTGSATALNRAELAGALITAGRTTPAAQASREVRLRSLRRAQEILETLTKTPQPAADADRVEQNLSILYDAIAETIADKDRPESFVEAYEASKKGLALAERRSRALPEDRGRQFNLAASYHQLAVAAGQLKRSSEVLDFRRKSLTVYERLSASDPQDKNSRMHQVYSMALLAEALAEENQMDAAEAILVQAQQLQDVTDPESAKQVFHRASGFMLPTVRAVIEAHRAMLPGVSATTRVRGCERARAAYNDAKTAANGLKDLFLDQAEDPLAETTTRMRPCAAVLPFPL